MTIYDVSEKAGVSIATVSRVLNGSDLVSARTRQKVLQVIEECGYTPNAFARGLGLNTMRTIGLLCADVSDSHIARAIFYLQRQLRGNDYDSILCCTEDEPDTRHKYVQLLLSKHVDALVFVGSHYVMSDEAQNKYIYEAAKQVPVMILIGALDGPNIYSVFSDDRLATCEATTKLLEHGKKDILYLYHAFSFSGRKKLQGYRDALTDFGIPIREELIVNCIERNDIGAVSTLLCSLAHEGLHFDAVVSSNDKLSVAAIKYAHMNGVRIPQDLQIIGFNNSSLAQCCDPELTSVDTNLESMCQTCVGTLMGVLSGQSMPKRSVFSGQLVCRQTTDFSI